MYGLRPNLASIAGRAKLEIEMLETGRTLHCVAFYPFNQYPVNSGSLALFSPARTTISRLKHYATLAQFAQNVSSSTPLPARTTLGLVCSPAPSIPSSSLKSSSSSP
jgi:hypothetical protein